ncbi:4-hydroxythreonine-4-phosphate dehydrogenase PdxA [cf. Phormidesmis sp. LEGE 11477]|uniref:4-hydroxythreonine-4-phosphate dehydrogenase PdxA n=1 Tax=cf. Phormidesmis sp. LEGE 11477 TaxID=1828680 RepID=UPI001D151322|nr:4-hydroxythreonine-4-phosphate dehydrogenase PdxA [cf. Phormidesmis sp. LEGE 11477]
MKPRLLVTLGDPAGIGSEVVLKALSNPAFLERADISVIGDRTLYQSAYASLKATYPHLIEPNSLKFIDIGVSSAITAKVIPGLESSHSGEISFRTLERAIARTLDGEFDGIVTAPIAKSAWLAAGHAYPGQTELLAEMSNTHRFGMLFVAKSPQNGWALRTLLATTHISLRDVPQALTPELMTLKLELLIECLQTDFGLNAARIAIAGLNPHSGEQGQLGEEEQNWLIPWLLQQQQRFPHIQLDGPIPPDTMWVKPGQAWHSSNISSNTDPNTAQSKAHDAYLALYHDQGLIPVKLLAFDLAVNTTIGLPFIRTSPDHGTAFDIAGKGIARSQSTEAALDLAIELANQRLQKSK